MTDAYKCDKCGELYENGDTQIGRGEGAHVGVSPQQLHLCPNCNSAFGEWLEQ